MHVIAWKSEKRCANCLLALNEIVDVLGTPMIQTTQDRTVLLLKLDDRFVTRIPFYF